MESTPEAATGGTRCHGAAPDAEPTAEKEPSPPTPNINRHLEHLAGVSLSKRRLSNEDFEGLRQFAAAAADRGTALRVLVAEYLDFVCRAWTSLPGSRRAMEPEDLRDVASAVIRAIDDATIALTEGYENAYRAAVRSEKVTRREFAGHLLEGRTGLGRLAERAERFGLRLAGPHQVAAQTPHPSRTPDNRGDLQAPSSARARTKRHPQPGPPAGDPHSTPCVPRRLPCSASGTEQQICAAQTVARGRLSFAGRPSTPRFGMCRDRQPGGLQKRFSLPLDRGESQSVQHLLVPVCRHALDHLLASAGEVPLQNI
ncbi:hypothetical protein [Streptomyces nigra]|uniref:hypothetical protein n=1 Tax=Streptomyces nigra TaxID=1827580 RepID=UPI0035D6F039